MIVTSLDKRFLSYILHKLVLELISLLSHADLYKIILYVLIDKDKTSNKKTVSTINIPLVY